MLPACADAESTDEAPLQQAASPRAALSFALLFRGK